MDRSNLVPALLAISFDINDGPTVYFSGDNGVCADMAIIRDLYRPEVAIMTVGGKYNMGYREAVYAAALILPEYVISKKGRPIHGEDCFSASC